VLPNGMKLSNSEFMNSKEVPLPYIGLRKYFIPDPRHQAYIQKGMMSVTMLENFLRLHVKEYVEDLGCLNKPYFAYNYKLYYPLASKMSLVQGTMLHDALDPEVAYMLKEKHVEGVLFNTKVAGDIDFYNEKSGVIYDLKTSKYLYNLPKYSHAVQLYLYGKLLEQNGYQFTRGTLLYMSHNQMSIMQFLKKRAGMDKYAENILFIDDIEKNLELRIPVNIDEYTSNENPVGKEIKTYENGKVENDYAYWRCAYCPFRRYCRYAKANITNYIRNWNINAITRYGSISKTFVNKFIASIRPAAVRENDAILQPEEELRDILDYLYGKDADRIIDEISKARRVKHSFIIPYVEVDIL